jgi:hypothetical protein
MVHKLNLTGTFYSISISRFKVLKYGIVKTTLSITGFFPIDGFADSKNLVLQNLPWLMYQKQDCQNHAFMEDYWTV